MSYEMKCRILCCDTETGLVNSLVIVNYFFMLEYVIKETVSAKLVTNVDTTGLAKQHPHH